MRAAQTLQGKVDIAHACCEIAPAKFLSLRLEVLRSNCRSVALTGLDLPVEVWLRLWLLVSLRAIGTKALTELGEHVRMFHKKLEKDEEAVDVDMIQSPWLRLIIPKIKHVAGVELAAKYFTEIFFSDEVMKLTKLDTPGPLVDICMCFYNGWHFVQIDVDADLAKVSDVILTAHDEVLQYATAVLAVAHSEPLVEGPKHAVVVFSEKHRKQLSKHGQDFIKALLSNRLFAKMIDDYWVLMERESSLVEQFWGMKSKLQASEDSAVGVCLDTLVECTVHLPHWRSDTGLRESACAVFHTAILKYLRTNVPALVETAKQQADEASLAATEELENTALKMSTVANLCKLPDVAGFKDQLFELVNTLSSASSLEKLKKELTKELDEGGGTLTKTLDMMYACKGQTLTDDDKRPVLAFCKKLYVAVAKSVFSSFPESTPEVACLNKSLEVLEAAKELVEKEGDVQPGHLYFKLTLQLCKAAQEVKKYEKHKGDLEKNQKIFNTYGEVCNNLQKVFPQIEESAKSMYQTANMAVVAEAQRCNAQGALKELEGCITSSLITAMSSSPHNYYDFFAVNY